MYTYIFVILKNYLHMKMCVVVLDEQGTNGSQLWDTAFAVTAMLEVKLIENESVCACVCLFLHLFNLSIFFI